MTADTPGHAWQVCVTGNLAVVADGDSGVTIFNVFDVVAVDQYRGVAILDISDPPAASVLHSLSHTHFAGGATSAALVGRLAYVGTRTGALARVDTESGEVLDRTFLAGGAYGDLKVVADVLYAHRFESLQVFDLSGGGLNLLGEVALGNQAFRGALSVGRTLAFATNSRGYDVIDISDPAVPVVLATATTSQFGWRRVIDGGSGLGIAAVGPNSTPDGPHDITLYDFTDPTVTNVALQEFLTPGIAEDITHAFGRIFVADGAEGVHVLNYTSYDQSGVAPTVNLATSHDSSGTVGATEFLSLRADATDDVQVRHVEFFMDGQRVGTDGSFPFEMTIAAPEVSAATDFVFAARAVDTGGNNAASNEITLTVLTEAVPPEVLNILPADGAVIGQPAAISFALSETVDQTSLETAFTLLEAGVDGTFDTADDTTIAPVEIAVSDENLLAVVRFDTPLTEGRYRATLSTDLVDLADNALAAPVVWFFSTWSPTPDSDGDCLSDSLEPILGYDPAADDTDNNGTPDGAEDFDNDTLTNCDEFALGTDPVNPDTNGDGILDGLEDSDDDGLGNGEELSGGTDPYVPDELAPVLTLT